MSKWKKVRLGDLGNFRTGGTPSRSKPEFFQGDIPWITTVALGKKMIDESDAVEFISDEALKKSSTKLIKPNSVMIGIRVGVGKTAINKVAMATNQDIISIEDIEESILHKPYLISFISSRSNLINSLKRGATIQGISSSVLKDLLIPLPPLDIQKQIAHELDTVSELLALRKQQLEELDQLIKSVFYEMFGDPVTNERGWEVKPFDQIGTLNSGGTPPRSNSSFFNGDINWFSAGELNSRYLHESKEKITISALSSSSAKLFDENSMLIGMYDTAAFKLGILTSKSSSNQACANIAVNKNLVNIEWLYDCCKLMRDFFLSNRRGVRQKNLTLGMIRSFEIPVPPLPIQDKFADIVTQIESQKALIKKAINETQLLFDSLMSKYFDD